MSLNDYKITQGDIASKGVQAAPDVLSGSPAENKAIFDRLISEAVAVQFNALIDKLVENGAEAILRRGDDSVLYLRLNADKVLEVSTDGKEYFSTVGSGHIIVDKYGKAMPKGLRLKFDNFEVREENGTIIVHGVAEEIAGAIPNTEKGAPNGVAELDAEGKVPDAQLPETMPPSAHAETHKTGGSDELKPEDIGAGRVNPNLLHNWYFANPVNQRGQTEYTGGDVYTIDRWITLGANSQISVVDGGVRVARQADGDNGRFTQRFDPALRNAIAGKICTLSVLISPFSKGGGSLHFMWDGQQVAVEVISKSKGPFISTTFTVPSSQTSTNAADYRAQISIAATGEGGCIVEAAKLELGTQQTLAHQDEDGNWVLNEIPDKGMELIRCQSAPVDLDGGGGVLPVEYRIVDGVKEWVNPPMQLGVEYRTTERYLGKPVYAKLVNLGTMPNVTTKSVDVATDGDYVVSVDAVHRISTSDKWTIYNHQSIDIMGNRAGSGNIVVRATTTADMSDYTINYALVKYTKTAD